MISSLTMLVIDKKKDIAVLQSFGADVSMLRKVFIIDGLLITMTGAISGLAIGFSIRRAAAGIQASIALGGSGTFVIDAHPVQNAADRFYLRLRSCCCDWTFGSMVS
ncbi:MAG: FtsX-like permease family protein [Bacteroidetes bacterium]|nr:FtsX-like permease family protein [Bacteroidota bacterium]